MFDYVVDDEGKEIEEEGGGGTSREGACVEKKGLAVAAFFEAVANQQREREAFSVVVSLLYCSQSSYWAWPSQLLS